MLKSLALKIQPIRRLWDDRLKLIAAIEQIRSSLSSANNKNAILSADVERLRFELIDARSPFYHYNSSFNAIELINKFSIDNIKASEKFLTNFLGVRISSNFLPSILAGMEGKVENIPIPANWHADIAEWAAALRAVDLAGETFRVIELGCGWGCWLLNTGCAARSRGKSVQLIGVEGDNDHLKFAIQGMADNEFEPSQFKIIHGIAASQKGRALFPIVENAGDIWSSEPILDATEHQIAEAMEKGTHHTLDTYSICEIANGQPVDLLHIDIQGGEADFVFGCLDDLNELVRYMVIGTHSRPIEGRIVDVLLKNGWSLEIERPAIFSLVDGKPQIQVDGVQGWRNNNARA